jgi:hypothetical protein
MRCRWLSIVVLVLKVTVRPSASPVPVFVRFKTNHTFITPKFEPDDVPIEVRIVISTWVEE